MRIPSARQPLHLRHSKRVAVLLLAAVLVALPDVRGQQEPSGPTPPADSGRDVRQIGQGLGGVVRTPDGKPAAGAVVLLSSEIDRYLSVVNGRFDERQLKFPWATTTGSDGRYAFASNYRERGMTVLHESGYADRSSGQVLNSPDVTLERWGRVEGVVRLGKKPGAGLAVGVHEEIQTVIGLGDGKESSFRQARRDYRSETKADAEGRFVLERVMPGPSIVHRLILGKEGFRHFSHIVHVDVPAGGTVQVLLGGTGRPVIGRFTSTEGTVPTVLRGNVIALLSDQTDLPTPPEFASYTPDQQQKWIDGFQASPAGKALTRQKQHFPFVIAPDGSFRADDIPPGRYAMTVTVHEKIVDGSSTMYQSRGLIQRVVQVPEPEPDPAHSDDSFDVGAVVLAPRDDRGLDVGAALPAIVVATLDGKPLNLADYRGKYVLLAFWASWCAPCRAETPHLQAAFEAFGKDDRFAMVGISLDETPEAARKYVAENRLAWTQGFVGQTPSERVTADLGVAGIPSIWLVGPDGKVVAKGLRGNRIRQALTEALGKPQ